MSWSRTDCSKARMVPFITARSGMILPLVPDVIWPTVSTAVSCAGTSRATRLCMPRRMLAAAVMGSMERCGIAPWPPAPLTSTVKASAEAMVGPGRTWTLPTGFSVVRWRP